MVRRVFVLGLCRNCAATLPSFLSMFQGLRQGGTYDIRILLGEDGSTDNTRDIIQTAAKADPHIALLDTSFMAKVPERLARMAAGREFLRDNLPPAEAGDLVIVVDADVEFLRPIDPGTLTAAITELSTPDTMGVCSYSAPCHYDILALRRGDTDGSAALDMYATNLVSQNLAIQLRRKVAAFRVGLTQRQLGEAKGRRFTSAFNGLCLYARPAFDQASYLGNGIECEHVNFHRSMRGTTGAMIQVSSHIGVVAPLEHLVTLQREIAGPVMRRLARLSKLSSVS